MPETRGHSLESISGAFRDHRVGDSKVLRILRGLASRVVGSNGLARMKRSSQDGGGHGYCNSGEEFELGSVVEANSMMGKRSFVQERTISI